MGAGAGGGGVVLSAVLLLAFCLRQSHAFIKTDGMTDIVYATYVSVSLGGGKSFQAGGK